MRLSLLITALLLFSGCSEEQQPAKKKAEAMTEKAVAPKQDVAPPAAVEASVKPVEKTAEAAAEPVKEKTVAEPVKPVAEAIEAPVEKIVQSEAAKSAEEAAAASPAIDGKALFSRCSGCHGQNAEKSAMNQSAIIKGWEASRTVTALKGYKDGTYGKTMKSLMKNQVSNLSAAEMESLAAYISTL